MRNGEEIMSLGEHIKELRKKKGLTLRELSKKIGISISFLSDIENSRSKPSLQKLEAIAKGLDVTVSYLLGEDNAQMPGFIKENCEFLYTASCPDDVNTISKISKVDPEVFSLFLELAPLSKEEQENLKIFLTGLSARRKFYDMGK